MNQTNSSFTGNTESDLVQKSRDQQEQIDSLAGSFDLFAKSKRSG
jgi:hypothetical protein